MRTDFFLYLTLNAVRLMVIADKGQVSALESLI